MHRPQSAVGIILLCILGGVTTTAQTIRICLKRHDARGLAGLMLHSFAKLLHVDTGVQTSMYRGRRNQ
jgi:hypothetical protein